MAIAITQTVIGSATAGTSFLLATMTPAANDLILVAVATRSNVQVTGVAGNGITFTLVRDQLQTLQSPQTRLSLWRGMAASPTAGQITVTCGATIIAAVAHAHRITGIDIGGTNGSLAVEAVNGAETGATDTNAPSVNVTTLTAGARAYGAFSHRSQTFTVGAGETAITLNTSIGSSGNITRLSTEYQDVANPATVTINGTLGAAIDWLAIGVSLKPATLGGTSIVASDSSAASDTGALGAASARVDTMTATEGASLADASVTVLDGGALTDSSALSQQRALVAVDSAALANTAQVEASAGNATVVAADTVTMAEAPSVIAQTFSSSDTASLADTSIVTVPLIATDSASAAEGTSALVRASSRTDAMALTDSGVLTTASLVVGTDSATHTETSLLNTNTLTIASSDLLALSENATTGRKAATDSAALTDTSSISSSINVAKAGTDSAAMTEQATAQTIVLQASDVITLTDGQALSWASLVTDSAAVDDAATLGLALDVTDSGALDESTVIYLSAADVVTCVEVPVGRETSEASNIQILLSPTIATLVNSGTTAAPLLYDGATSTEQL